MTANEVFFCLELLHFFVMKEVIDEKALASHYSEMVNVCISIFAIVE